MTPFPRRYRSQKDWLWTQVNLRGLTPEAAALQLHVSRQRIEQLLGAKQQRPATSLEDQPASEAGTVHSDASDARASRG
ncbi:MAG: hypothetical protein SXG53_03530 [Pseudomonadota bacterium]|nr:hypothetical protein [Pseudomonadota bacterium]